ncbi:MAG: alpha/beta fold hydrolase, partial [Gammaproteobacteria bacterium]
MGWRGVFMHFRGCSGEPNRLARCYHAGETEDFAALVDTLRQREPHTPLAAVGFSLGGNVLLKWLGELGERAPLQAAVAVSVPFDLANSVQRINEGFSRAYQLRLVRGLRKSIQAKFNRIAAPPNLGNLRRLRSIREYDDNVTAPLHGFANADEYYSRSSSRQYLKNIRIPTLILHATDDPLMSAQAIPQTNELSSSTRLELSERGGHLGFVGGKYPWRPEYWLELRISEFLSTTLRKPA